MIRRRRLHFTKKSRFYYEIKDFVRQLLPEEKKDNNDKMEGKTDISASCYQGNMSSSESNIRSKSPAAESIETSSSFANMQATITKNRKTNGTEQSSSFDRSETADSVKRDGHENRHTPKTSKRERMSRSSALRTTDVSQEQNETNRYHSDYSTDGKSNTVLTLFYLYPHHSGH